MIAYKDNEVRERLLGWYGRASDEQRRDGRRWYLLAHKVATEFALLYGCTVSTAAGVIAALSPMKSWTQNLALAADCLAGDPVRTLTAHARTAQMIRGGVHPGMALKGRKTLAFYRAIMGDGDAVVIDRWMIRALGLPDTTRLSPKQYDTLAAKVAANARAVGVPAAEFQATVWCVIRGRSF